MHPRAPAPMLWVMDIRYAGGLKVDALADGFWVCTDQPSASGGEGSAPSPFDLFLASIGTCAGFYALRFCQQRDLDSEGLALTLTPEREPGDKRISSIRIEIALPPSFPEKYRQAIIRAVDQCAVKRYILEPPRFEVTTVEQQEIPSPSLDSVLAAPTTPPAPDFWPTAWPG